MSKSETLDMLFEQSDSIHREMEQIFVKNNVPHLHLEKLPKDDLQQWRELHKKSNELGQIMCQVIAAK